MDHILIDSNSSRSDWFKFITFLFIKTHMPVMCARLLLGGGEKGWAQIATTTDPVWIIQKETGERKGSHDAGYPSVALMNRLSSKGGRTVCIYHQPISVWVQW